MKVKNSNFHSLKVTTYNCFFSQVCEVSHGMLHNRKSLITNQLNNCHATHQNNQILIISQGGNRYQLPMDQQVLRVFPLAEGILIEFIYKQQPKLSEILYYQKSKNIMDIEEITEGKYCYATLTRHPLNPLKILGEVRNQQIVGWMKVQEKVTCVSASLPILLTYNVGLYRNAFHILLANSNQVKKQYQNAFLPTQSYSLKSVGDSGHSELLTQTIFQQNNQSQEILQIEMNKSSKSGCIIMYALTNSEVRVFQINLYAMTNSTKLLTIIKNPLALQAVSLYPKDMFFPEPFQRNKKGLLIDLMDATTQSLPDSVAIINKHSISYYYAGQTISSIGITQQFKLINHILPLHIQSIIPNCLISDNFDALVIRVLQIALEDEQIFLILLRKYCCGQPLLPSIILVYRKSPKIFTALHFLYEQLKLYELMRSERKRIGEIVMDIAVQDGLSQYIDYYLRQGYPLVKQANKLMFKLGQQVYDLFWNFSRMLNRVLPRNCPVLFGRTQFVINFLQLLIYGKIVENCESFARDMFQSKYQHGKQYFYRTRYPLLSQKVFHLDYYGSVYEEMTTKEIQTDSKEQKAFLYLVNHNHNHHDILSYPLSIRAIFYCILRQMRLNLPQSLYEMIPKLGFYLIHREDLYKNIRLYRKNNKNVPYHLAKPSFDQHIKTLVHTSTSHQYFLTSNASQMNKLNNDLVFEEVDRLLSTSTEIHVKVKDIQSIPQDRWEIESQNILQKFANRRLAVLIGQGSFTLGTSRSFITDIIKIPKINLSAIMPNDIKITLDLKEDKESLIFWPQFHSGMAAGLRLSRHVIPLSQDHLKTWIFYQKPDTPKRDHSGFLLSLGLLGYLRCFSPTDIYQYLKPNNQFTSVAILLGVSASNISKSEQAISKTLILHIPVLLPPTVDVQIPINVQTSALIGLGLLHKGTCNRPMAEMALSQIGKKPTTDKCLDREGYSLAAGWALGMICLGIGQKKQSFRDLHLEERLIRFIQGGKKMEPPQSMMSANLMNQNKCSSIKEGPNVNLHITAPSALLAISLMYLKSNNKDLADKISIPNSFNTIEECNPNHILLKTLAKNLIMWDSISNTQQFIHNQVPQLIRFIYQNPLRKVYERYYLVYNVPEIDYQTITTIYASVMTGAILTMSLKYAGTGNRGAMQTIKWHIDHLKTIKIIKCQFANDPINKNCIDQYQLFSLLSTSLLALSIVMAGTCDIQCLKIIRIVRKKFQDSKVFHYGFSMAINMAIGFIFLGYGNYTFNREDMSIAALLISVFPQYPNSPTDNKWHLQALRHFYVLAMEEKIFHAVDVDTNKVVNVNTQMQFLVDGQVITEELHTPILLQQSKKLIRVKIKDDDYFDLDFSFDKTKSDPKAIYIKRKHFKDINQKLMNPQNPLSTQIIRNSIKHNLQQQHRYTSLIDLDKKSSRISYLLPNSKNLDKIQFSSKSKFPHDIYYKLLKQDKMEMLQIYLTLTHQLSNPTKTIDNLFINNFNLLLAFEKFQGDQFFLNLTRDSLQQYSIDLVNRREFKNYLIEPSSQRQIISAVDTLSFHQVLKLVNLPSSKNIVLMRDAIQKLKSKGQSSSVVEMLVYMNFPQCSMTFLNKLVQNYFN